MTDAAANGEAHHEAQQEQRDVRRMEDFSRGFDEAEQEALFEIEGPDEDGCVWICSPAGREVWCRNLGPGDKVAEKLAAWLAEIDFGE